MSSRNRVTLSADVQSDDASHLIHDSGLSTEEMVMDQTDSTPQPENRCTTLFPTNTTDFKKSMFQQENLDSVDDGFYTESMSGLSFIKSEEIRNEFTSNNSGIKPVDSKQCLPEPIDENSTQPIPTSIEYINLYFQGDEDGDTLLHISIIHQKTEWIEHILSCCVAASLLNSTNNMGQTVLHLAVLTNQCQITRKLLCAGADIDTRNLQGDTALHLACKIGCLECVKSLTTPLSQIDIQNSQYAIPYRKIPQDLHLYNYDGETCMHIAFASNHHKIVDHLLRVTDHINMKDGKTGRTILHLGVLKKDLGFVENLLKQPKIDINALTFAEQTPLQLAKLCKSEKITDILIKYGADTDFHIDPSAYVDSGSDEPDL